MGKLGRLRRAIEKDPDAWATAIGARRIVEHKSWGAVYRRERRHQAELEMKLIRACWGRRAAEMAAWHEMRRYRKSRIGNWSWKQHRKSDSHCWGRQCREYRRAVQCYVKRALARRLEQDKKICPP